jgi:hypothetical protein
LINKLLNCTKNYDLGIVMDQCMGIPLLRYWFIHN